MFSSRAPYLIPSCIFSINFNSFVASPLPALNISSTTIFIDSVREDLLPSKPLLPANKPADEKFLVCVAGDNTVLPY